MAHPRLDRPYVDDTSSAAALRPGIDPLPARTIDIVLEEPKSVSVYYAALRVKQRADDAEQALTAHETGVDQAVAYLHREAGYVKLGYHLPSGPDGRTVGEYARADGLRIVQLEHVIAADAAGADRDQWTGPPHIHTHVLVLPTAPQEGAGDGEVDREGLRQAAIGARGVYRAAADQAFQQRFPSVAFTPATGVQVPTETVQAMAGRWCRVGELEQLFDPDWV